MSLKVKRLLDPCGSILCTAMLQQLSVLFWPPRPCFEAASCIIQHMNVMHQQHPRKDMGALSSDQKPFLELVVFGDSLAA